MGLLPLELSKRVRGEDWEGIQALGLNDCMTCGSCAYVCPSHIPLPQYFAYARGMLAAQRREEQKTRRTRELMEQRQARFERQERAKAEAAARRRAEKKQRATILEEDEE
jgi:electron transport complex protein RnfC